MGCHFLPQGNLPACIAGGFFTTEPPVKSSHLVSPTLPLKTVGCFCLHGCAALMIHMNEIKDMWPCCLLL